MSKKTVAADDRNASCLALGLTFFPPPASAAFWPCIAGWAVGFLGNGKLHAILMISDKYLTTVYHDEILNDLRRPAGARLVSSPHKEDIEEDKKAGNGRYAIPRGGLFEYVSLPNYLCEW